MIEKREKQKQPAEGKLFGGVKLYKRIIFDFYYYILIYNNKSGVVILSGMLYFFLG